MNKKVLIIGGVVLVAAVGGFLIYRNYKKKSESKLPSPTGAESSDSQKTDVSTDTKTETAVSTPESKPSDTKTESPKVPLVKGFQTFQDKLKSVAQAQNQPAPKIETYKSSKPISIKKSSGIGMAIIPIGANFQATLIQKIDDNNGVFQGFYNGMTFNKTLSFSDIQKV